MAPKSKVELYAAIRRNCRAGLSKRAAMRKVRHRAPDGAERAGVGLAPSA
jgi:hypothetical protein